MTSAASTGAVEGANRPGTRPQAMMSWQQPVVNGRNPVFQGKLLLLQPLNKQLICHWVTFQRNNLIVEHPMLGFEFHQFVP